MTRRLITKQKSFMELIISWRHKSLIQRWRYRMSLKLQRHLQRWQELFIVESFWLENILTRRLLLRNLLEKCTLFMRQKTIILQTLTNKIYQKPLSISISIFPSETFVPTFITNGPTSRSTLGATTRMMINSVI